MSGRAGIGPVFEDEMADKKLTNSSLSYNPEPVCPYCGYKDQDFIESGFQDGEHCENSCPQCEKQYKVEAHVRVEFSTRGICTEPHRLHKGMFKSSPFECESCHEEFYDWQLPGGMHPRLKEGEFVIVASDPKMEDII